MPFNLINHCSRITRIISSRISKTPQTKCFYFLPNSLAIDLGVIVIVVGIHHDGLLGLLVVNLLLNFPGTPIQSEYGSTTVSSGITVPAAMMQPSPILALFRITQPMPMRQRSPMVQPCKRDGVAHGDIVADDHAVLVAHAVEHAAILHAAVPADADGKDVTADDGVHPYAGVLADFHVANDLGGLVDIAAIMNAW